MSSLNRISFNVDVVLLAGGGAIWYPLGVRRLFRYQRVMVMGQTENSYGFGVFAGGGACWGWSSS